MNRYLKLVNFELSRFFKIYLVLIGLTLVLQLIGVVIGANGYMGELEEVMKGGTTQAEFLMERGAFSFADITRGFWFFAPIALSAASIFIYIFFIWYRDWFGKNTFAYRLFMLPTARINVFLAKATSIFLMVLGLIALQLVFLSIERSLMNVLVPSEVRLDLTIAQMINSFDNFQVLYPDSFIQFMINYGIGFMAVLVVFTAILMERSFRWKGILLGALFAGLAAVVFLSPFLVQAFVLKEFFYPIELFILAVITGLIVIAGTIWTSNYLLNKKIRV
ncbi:hypothetical protein [Ornithinibacillus contaminans]|uniref:hypothetical protein n=1 Tax=Ornithinibacillus contaminans TaxID=694055 RepID=UPI00064DCC6F|nr:hypothetical protein [Ornithinibacillus contaminans]